ncbi:MAG: DUF4369 domain-containing protein [Sphingobacteriales bacterium]
MKYTFIIFLALIVASGCIKKRGVELSGVATGVKNGTLIIKDDADSTVDGINIKDGKFSLEKHFATPGYFKLYISEDGKTDSIKPVEVYLEDGSYTIETDKDSLNKYPKITSASKIQWQLSTFYALDDKAGEEAARDADLLTKVVKTQSEHLSPVEFTNLLKATSAANAKIPAADVVAFKEFIKEYPHNDISIRLMDDLHYGTDPKSFYAIFQTLPAAMRNSERGKYIGSELSHLVKLLPGALAPEIHGKTPDGKEFYPEKTNHKYILIDFWRSSSMLSRTNHQKLRALLNDPQYAGKIRIISVSLDSNHDEWIKAIKEDNMNCIQISDMKGDNSPNIAAWMIPQYPAYYLLDSQWHTVKSDILYNYIDEQVMLLLQSRP